MNVFITGGTGFIGSRLALKCLERGDQVKILGQVNTAAERQNKQVLEQKGATIVLGSVTNKELIFKEVKGTDIVFHLAAAQHEMNILDKVFWDVNVEGTRNILEASLNAKVKRFIHGSTIGVYGALEGRIDENSPCNPDNIYGKTKLEGERVALSFADKLPVVVVRIPETYGPGDRRLLKLFKGVKKRRFFIIGNGDNFHHLIYVDDLVEGLLLASKSKNALGEIILIAGPQPITTEEMVKTVAKVLDTEIPPLRLPLFPFMLVATILEKSLRPLGIQPPLHRRRMDFFRKSFVLNTSKAQKLMSFKPMTSFEQGARQTAQWYMDEGLLDGATTKKREGSKILVDPHLTAQIEPFDTFWEAPEDIEKGYGKFATFYKRNYLKYLPKNQDIRTLVVSCGAGYFVDLMCKEGYTNVLGIDSDPDKIAHAKKRGLNCLIANAFPFLSENTKPFDLIFVEQEINHLTKPEILEFLDLCHKNLDGGGILIVHSLNGANPITGSEALAQNFNHFNTFTEYSLRQILEYQGFEDVRIFPLNLYVFYNNPLNYVGLVIDKVLSLSFRLLFMFYGKTNKIFTKKIAAVAVKTDTKSTA